MTPGTDSAALPLTTAQLEVWRAQHLLGDRNDFVITLLVEITGPLDLDLARESVHTVIADADALHVRFDFSGDDPVQYRVDHEWAVEVVDLSATDDPMAAARTWIADDVASADTSGAGDLFATALLVLADEHVLWHQRYHHSIVDGFGMSLIFNEVRERYADPTRRVAAGDWALEPLVDADRTYRASDAFQRDRDYWMSELFDAPEPPTLLVGSVDSGDGRAVT
ncbi:MAG: condensation domain-containing protein, partial [Rhodococcus sp. (in: high G+C Gram-positive bacteria)]